MSFKASFALLALSLVVLLSQGHAESFDLGGSTVELISNTSECLTDCEAWLEWDLTSSPLSIPVPIQPNSSFNVNLLQKNPESWLKDFGVEVYSFDSKAKAWFKAGDFYGFVFEKGKKYRLRVWGKQLPKLGSYGVDWQLTVAGTTLAQWAWWNSSWQYRRNIVISPLADLNAGYPVDINHQVFDFGECFTDGKCQGDFDDLRVVCNNSEISVHYEDDNSTDFNALWFKLPEPVSSGDTFSGCELYYGNQLATSPGSSDINLMATDSGTVLLYRLEENAANTKVYDYSGNGNDGVSRNNTSTLSVVGVWKNAFDFKVASTDYVTFPKPQVVSGTMEAFVQIDSAAPAGANYTIAGVYNGAADKWYLTTAVSNTADCGDATCWYPEFISNNGAVNWDLKPVGYPFKRGQWYHVAVTWGSGTTSLVVDGNTWATATGGALASPVDRPTLGARRRQDTATWDDYFEGSIDEFRVSSTVDTNFYKTYPFDRGLVALHNLSLGSLDLNTNYNYLYIYVPKDEETGLSIVDSEISYSLIVDDGNISYYSGLKEDQVFDYLKDDELSIRLVVDENTSTYYRREYYIDFNGVGGTYTFFQPYLPKVADSGDFIFSVVDSTTLNPIKDIEISVWGAIPGAGIVEIQNQVTDSSGQANIPLLLDNSYTIYFKYNGVLVHTATITPTPGSLYYRVGLNLTDVPPQTVLIPILSVKFYPTTPFLLSYAVVAGGTAKSLKADFNIAVSFIDFNITRMVTYVLDTNNCLYDINSFGGTWVDGNMVYYSIDLNTGNATNLFNGLPCKYDFNYNFPLYLRIDANATTDTNYYATSIHWQVINPLSFFEYTLAGGLSKIASLYGKIVTTLLAAFIALCACGSIAAMGVHDPAMLAIVTLAILGMFLFVGWIELLPFLFVGIATIFSIFLIQAVIR